MNVFLRSPMIGERTRKIYTPMIVRIAPGVMPTSTHFDSKPVMRQLSKSIVSAYRSNT